MSGHIAERIEKPPHFRIAPLVRGRGKRPPYIVGFDSEAERDGTPMLYQFALPDTDPIDVRCIVVGRRKGAGLDAFMSFVHHNLYEQTRKHEVLIYGYNLAYEFTQLFADLPSDITELSEFTIDYQLRNVTDGPIIGNYMLRVFNEKRYAVTIERDHRRIRVLDAAAFFPGGLDAAGKMLGVGRKIDLSSKRFTRADLDTPYFLEYARQDAWLTRRIGETIIDMHVMYDTPTCLSAPHFAARVFRRHFLTGEIPLCPSDLEQAGLSSYHGGKNGYYAAGPQTIERIYQYDITSAYPEAMRALPDPVTATWTYVTDYRPDVHALYCVTMTYQSCKYRGGMSHADGWLHSGHVDGVWITSYELDAILARGEATLFRCVGYVMDGTSGSGPLAAYVDRFFDLKRTSTGMMRATAKLFLNSLYGKFFQKVPLGSVGFLDLLEDGSVEYVIDDPSSPYSWQAGGLYHPAIASLITGYVRAKIHRLEHKYRAVMTSTDGFFAYRRPDAADIGTDLGALTVERGHLDIWRERLYDFRADHHHKIALHAFRGDVHALHRIPLIAGKYRYQAEQMVTLRLATRTLREHTYHAGEFATLSYKLDLTRPP
ncbi:MAG: DNA polymerase [Candidatus Limnocylindrales bacterium]